MVEFEDSGDLTPKVDFAGLKEELSKNGMVICPAQNCNQDFSSLGGLKYHLKQANHQISGERRFKCEQCNLLFQSRVHLRNHRAAEHSDGESGSPLVSPLSSPSLKEKKAYTLAPFSNSSNHKTTQVRTESIDLENSSEVNSQGDFLGDMSASGSQNNGNVSCSGSSANQASLKKSKDSSDSVLESRTSVPDANSLCSENHARFVGSSKRKRGRPRKADFESTVNEVSLMASPCPDQLTEISSSSRLNANDKIPPSDITPARRTSSRVRTPRKIFYIDVDKSKDDNLQSSSRKRGRKRKSVTDVNSDEDDETDVAKKLEYKTPKKRGRKPKRTNITSEDVDSVRECNDESVSNNNGKEKVEEKRSVGCSDQVVIKVEDEQQENEESFSGVGENKNGDDYVEDDHHGDDVDHDDGGVDGSCTPGVTRTDAKEQNGKENGTKENTSTKKLGRKPKRRKGEVSEVTLLKEQTKYGKKLICTNEGCGAKFASALGYVTHRKTCGIKEEEREKFSCEICGKEYNSVPGLTYHMKTKHVESETDSNDQTKENEEAAEPEVTETGRVRRKAASRALSKVHQLATDHDMVSKTDETEENDKPIKKSDIDQLITAIPGRQVSQKLEERWSETVEAGKNINCPCKGCLEKFPSIVGVKDHLKTCEKAVSHKCLACGKVFTGWMVAQNHVKHWHVGYSPAGKDKSDSSDADYVVISSDEDDEDEDCVEIEEVEDSGSDILEDSDEAEEIVVWDDTTKRNSRFKLQQRREIKKNAKLYVNSVGNRNSTAYKATEKWRKEAFKHNELFPNLRPSSSYWSAVDSSEIDQYVPKASKSPQFVVRRPKQKADGEELVQLPLFGSTAKSNSSVFGDVTFNVGGPVWAMDWCPIPDSRNSESQFLAISTHRSLDKVHSIHKTIPEKGLIQLWDVGKLKVNSASSGSGPTLSLGIAHNYGAIWDLSWCPSGTWEPKLSTKKQNGALSRLGLMAVACSDGLVRILSIPWPTELFSTLCMKQSNDHTSYPPVIVHAVPHAVLMPCALGVAYNGQCGQAWCVKWIPHSMHEKIATGFSDGTVAIWNLMTESRLLKRQKDDEGKTFCLAPFLHIITNSSVVRSLAWCPENPNIFATGSYDREYKVWNLTNPYMPIVTFRRAHTTEMYWSVVSETVMSSEDDCYQSTRLPCIVRTFNFTNERSFAKTSKSTIHNSTIWSVHVSDWAKLLACGDASGEVETVNLRKKQSAKFGIYRVYLEKLDHDGGKEGGKKQGSQNEGAHIAGTERGDANKDRESAGEKQGPNLSEGSKENYPDTSTGKEVKDLSLPRTTEETFQQYKLVFYDVNTIEFADIADKSDPEVKRHLDVNLLQSAPYNNFTNPQAILKVRFNPNKQAFTWLASGGAAGLARLHLVKQLTAST